VKWGVERRRVWGGRESYVCWFHFVEKEMEKVVSFSIYVNAASIHAGYGVNRLVGMVGK